MAVGVGEKGVETTGGAGGLAVADFGEDRGDVAGIGDLTEGGEAARVPVRGLRLRKEQNPLVKLEQDERLAAGDG